MSSFCGTSMAVVWTMMALDRVFRDKRVLYRSRNTNPENTHFCR